MALGIGLQFVGALYVIMFVNQDARFLTRLGYIAHAALRQVLPACWTLSAYVIYRSQVQPNNSSIETTMSPAES